MIPLDGLAESVNESPSLRGSGLKFVVQQIRTASTSGLPLYEGVD